MDSFMDKLAQRMNAQDIIKANQAAEAAETDRLKTQLELYETCIQEMRKVNLKNAENAEKVNELLNGSIHKMEEMLEQGKKEDSEKQIELLTAKLDEMKGLLDNQKADFAEMMNQSDDFNHKENLKVYRNVQAVIIEELGKQTKEIVNEIDESVSGTNSGAVLPLTIITLVVLVANVAILVLHILGLF